MRKFAKHQWLCVRLAAEQGHMTITNELESQSEEGIDAGFITFNSSSICSWDNFSMNGSS